jgi:hypothetical protein
MQLWEQRSEVRDWLGGVTYRLAMALLANAMERSALARHGLASSELWASPAALALDAEAEAALAKVTQVPLVVFGNREAVRKNAEQSKHALWLAREARKEARTTVGELLKGTVLSSREIAELEAARAGIRQGFDALARKLVLLVDYEIGHEALIDPTLPCRRVNG